MSSWLFREKPSTKNLFLIKVRCLCKRVCPKRENVCLNLHFAFLSKVVAVVADRANNFGIAETTLAGAVR